MGKVKTGNPDSDKAKVIENVTLKYCLLVQPLKYPYSQS